MKLQRHSAGDASPLTALLLPHIFPICSVVAPCQRGASPPSVRRRTFTTGCLLCCRNPKRVMNALFMAPRETIEATADVRSLPEKESRRARGREYCEAGRRLQLTVDEQKVRKRDRREHRRRAETHREPEALN